MVQLGRLAVCDRVLLGLRTCGTSPEHPASQSPLSPRTWNARAKTCPSACRWLLDTSRQRNKVNMSLYTLYGKRTLDATAATGGLILLSPVLAAIALLIRFDDRGPIFFRQKRVGKGGTEFLVWKFRSMPVGAPQLEASQAQSLPITGVGRVLRRLSLDELPQLINIVRGEMSLVGPRPPMPSQVELIELRRANGSLDVRPGITGLAQINGYEGMPNDQKALLDGRYANGVSLSTDLGILFRTLSHLAKTPPTY